MTRHQPQNQQRSDFPRCDCLSRYNGSLLKYPGKRMRDMRLQKSPGALARRRVNLRSI